RPEAGHRVGAFLTVVTTVPGEYGEHHAPVRPVGFRGRPPGHRGRGLGTARHHRARTRRGDRTPARHLAGRARPQWFHGRASVEGGGAGTARVGLAFGPHRQLRAG